MDEKVGFGDKEQIMSFLELKNISKKFGDVTAVNNVSLAISKGEFFSLVGPSGCGKTTLLRIIAGLENQTSGNVILDGKDISKTPPQKREMGIVFQNYALFPHMNVFDNVSYALNVRKMEKSAVKNKVMEELEKVRLSHKADSKVSELSGGEQQRTALARVLAYKPALILFDEPLSNLDYELRLQARTELKRLQKEEGTTSIYVTHDQAEAFALSDRMAVMNAGYIVQSGKPQDVYYNPGDDFTASFISHANIFSREEAKKYLNLEIEKEKIYVLPEQILLTESPTGLFEVIDTQFGGITTEYTLKSRDKLVKAVGEFKHFVKVSLSVKTPL